MSSQVVEPIKEWRPHPRQEDFLTLPDEIDEGFFGGAVGGGKSEVLLLYPIVKKWHEIRGFTAIYFRESFPQLDKSLIKRSIELGIYKSLGGIYNHNDHTWRFPRYNSSIIFDYLDNDSTCYKHDTNEYNAVFFEELTQFSQFQYTYMMTRCRGIIHVMRSASNPGGKGHAWVKKRFIDPCKTGYEKLAIVTKKAGRPDRITYRIFIPSKLIDNPSLTEKDPNYIARLEEIADPALRRAKIEGDWDAFLGQVFLEFRKLKLPDEPENALHVIEPFDIPSWWPKLIYVDWGYDHNTAIYWGAVSPDGRLFIYREYVCRKTRVSTWASDCKRLSQFDGNIVEVGIDPSAKGEGAGLEKTVYEQFVDSSGFENVVFANNDRISGKALIHDLLRFEQRPATYRPREGYLQETYDRLYRQDGLKIANEYKKTFEPPPFETNLPKIQIFNHCVQLIETIPVMSSDPKRPEDVLKYDGDDAYDAFRYMCMAFHRFTEESKDKFEKMQKVGVIIKSLEETGDYTSYYRKMEKYEADNKVVNFIQRGSYRRH